MHVLSFQAKERQLKMKTKGVVEEDMVRPGQEMKLDTVEEAEVMLKVEKPKNVTGVFWGNYFFLIFSIKTKYM